MAEREPVIGIDLGTTNSVVATVQGNQPVVIKSRSGSALTPSVVAVTKQGKRLVGQIAKRQAITNPQDTVYASKRLIGRKFSAPEVQAALKSLTYQVVAGLHDDIRVMLAGVPVSLPEVSALVLQELKQDAEAYLGRPVSRAVITVPAYFNDGQRQATKDAGKIAGLEVLRIVNEPTAAALAYGFGKNVHGKLAVFDLGGGTFDISVLEVGGDVFDVLAVGGDTYLGGEDLDQRIIDSLAQAFSSQHGIDLRKDRMALQRLKDAAEKAKIELSSARETQINLPFVYTPPGGGAALHLQTTFTREKLEGLAIDLVDRAVSITESVLREARVRPADLKEIILVGGQTRMPLVAERVKSFFRRDPCKGVHPEEVVALGAAIQAEALTSGAGQVLLLDVTPQSLGVAIAGGYARTLVPKNTTVPTSATEVFNTSKDFQNTVKIVVLQGDKELANQNAVLGEFLLTGLREALRGEVEIEVTFEISSEGILSVSARDKETGKRQSIVVTASGGLTDEERDKILEAQRDYLLEARSSELASQRKSEAAAGVKELREMIPRLQGLTQGSEFGQEALSRAHKAIADAEAAVAGADLKQLTEAVDQLQRTSALFKGVIERIGTSGQ